METSNLQMFKRPPHEKDNTNTLVEKTKNSKHGQVSKSTKNTHNIRKRKQ
jgi:hypothetical protein